MNQNLKVPSRKKILLWGATLLSSLAVFKIISGNKNKTHEAVNKTVKMLMQDGRLVEVDKKLLASTGKKITDEELQKWIKK